MEGCNFFWSDTTSVLFVHAVIIIPCCKKLMLLLNVYTWMSSNVTYRNDEGISLLRGFDCRNWRLYCRHWWCCRPSWLLHLSQGFCQCYCVCRTRNICARCVVQTVCASTSTSTTVSAWLTNILNYWLSIFGLLLADLQTVFFIMAAQISLAGYNLILSMPIVPTNGWAIKGRFFTKILIKVKSFATGVIYIFPLSCTVIHFLGGKNGHLNPVSAYVVRKC